MNQVVVCYKWVMYETYLRINGDLSVDASKVMWKINSYDKNAIEAGVRVAKAAGTKVTGLTFGSDAARKSFKDALSRGLDNAYFVYAAEADGADAAVTGRSLAAGVKQIGMDSLIVCSEGSSDKYQRQIASRIGALLDVPVITSVASMSIEGNVLTATRRLEGSMQTVCVELPAVVSVLPEINEAPIPAIKAILAAKKKETVELSAEELGVDLTSASTVSDTQGYVTQRKNIVFADGSVEERVSAFVEALRKEGVA